MPQTVTTRGLVVHMRRRTPPSPALALRVMACLPKGPALSTDPGSAIKRAGTHPASNCAVRLLAPSLLSALLSSMLLARLSAAGRVGVGVGELDGWRPRFAIELSELAAREAEEVDGAAREAELVSLLHATIASLSAIQKLTTCLNASEWPHCLKGQ